MKVARLIVVFLLFTATRVFSAAPAGYYLVWSDEFNGSSLDTTKWDYWLLGNRRDAVNTTAAVSVTGGNLVISTYTSGGVNYTAMVANDQKFRTKYGYWESSVKWGDTNGMWSAIWMQSPTMGANINDPFTSGSEIDIGEHRYVDGSGNSIANQIQPNVHWNGYGADARSSGGNNYGSGLATGFHTYGFLWTPTDYTISIDGGNVRNWNFAVNGVPVSRSTEWMIFSSEVDDTSTTWAGQIPVGGYGDLGVSGVKMTIDYARYYAPTSSMFWTGSNSLAWNNSANWIEAAPLGAASDVTFSYLSGNNLATTLGADTTIDSLTVLDMNNALSISGNTLTIGAGGVDTTSANHSVNLNSVINLGAAQNWQIGSAFPVNVNSNLTGSVSLTKVNAGTLNLNASNSFSGTLYVDSNASGILSDGKVVIANPGALANAASPIQIRNGNSCSSTLAFSGGNINLKQNIQMACRNNTVASLENISGTNTISGNIFISQGGSNAVIQCDAGILNIAGNIAYNGSLVGNRSWNFVSTGTNVVSGAIPNAANGSIISISQSGSGALVLSNANSYAGGTRILSGTLRLGDVNAVESSTVNLDAGDTGTLSFGRLTSAEFGSLTGVGNLLLQNDLGQPVTLGVGGPGAYAGVLSGSGGFTKGNSYDFALANSNTYTGGTIVQTGTLKLSRDPVVKLTFDSVSGTAAGSIVTNSGTAGTALNGVVVTNGVSGVSFVAGRVGKALSLAGDGSFIAISNRVVSLDGSTAGVSWTLAMWIKTTQAGAGFAYQGDGGWGNNNTAFYLNQGNTSAGTRVGAVRYAGGWLTGSVSVNDGNWHFITITDNSGTKTIYVDGNLDTTTAGWPNVSVGNQFWIGGTADTGDGVGKFNGLIDEVSIYNRALSLAEVRSLTNAQPAAVPGNFGGQLPASTLLAISPGAVFDLNGNSQALGGLGAANGAMVTNSGAALVTLTIGATGGGSSYKGSFGDSAANPISLVKVGASSQVIGGVNNYSGTTTVNGGELLVDGVLGTNTVSLAGGVLAGNGVINGPLTVSSSGSLAPGDEAVGVLTVSNDVALLPSSTVAMELDKTNGTNDLLNVSGTLHYDGTLMVTNLTGTLAGGDSFQLFNASASTGNFSSISGSPGAGLDWKFNPVTGRLTVFSTMSTNINASITGGVLQVSWPADHLGWHLQVQTNGLTGTWMDWPGTASVTSITNLIDPSDPPVFFRLVYP
ncbi:MAG TPA: LamG-like jellyroll fold domain-containing protein [Verrucomicrobiae bacterium]|nr:LamG-like jellyroll fold domain-containing protein [Verrucomicrobiae bacterium]